ncbi:MAG: alpha/beta fold hydrolase [Actinomycetota bacterium]
MADHHHHPGEADAPYRVEFTPDPELYPFTSRWFDSSVGAVHYLDEGEGRPLLLMHGNPDWSFLYRKMIPLLTPHFRCIAMDYPGFGLSVHPAGYSYLPRDHAAIVAELVTHLDLQDAVLVGQDWGGPIGFDVASRMPERFSGLVAGNTMMWPATPFFIQRTFSQLTGLGFVQRLLVARHLFVRRVMPALVQGAMTEAELRHYLDVAPTPHSRVGHAIFPKAIVGETEWLADLEERVAATLADRPMLRIMGMKDVPLTTKAYLRKWAEMWPQATTLDLPDAGHFWQEDAPEEAAAAIVAAYAQHPNSQQPAQRS